MPVSGIPKDWEQKEGFGRRHGCRILRPKNLSLAKLDSHFLDIFICSKLRLLK